jgi:hypothetical protein
MSKVSHLVHGSYYNVSGANRVSAAAIYGPDVRCAEQ